MNSNFIALITAAISLAAFSGASSICFFPNGQPVEEYDFNLEPCNGRNTTWQQYCEFGDVCTEDGICMYSEDQITPTIFYRAGCTNRDWSGCPQVCPHGEFIVVPLYRNRNRRRHGELSLDRCDTGKYCCHDKYIDCCEYESQQLSLSDHNPGTKNNTDVTKRVTIGAAVGGALGGLAMIGGAVGVWLYLRKKKVKKGMRQLLKTR